MCKADRSCLNKSPNSASNIASSTPESTAVSLYVVQNPWLYSIFVAYKPQTMTSIAFHENLYTVIARSEWAFSREQSVAGQSNLNKAHKLHHGIASLTLAMTTF